MKSKPAKVSEGKRERPPIKLCPVCGSRNITLWMGASLGVNYVCKKCGYHGPLVMEEYLSNK